MREELNIYINGKPYVLREDERPFKNMQARLHPASGIVTLRRAAGCVM